MITTAKGYMNELSSMGSMEDELRQMLQMAMAIEQRLRLKVADTAPDPQWHDSLDDAFNSANDLVTRLHALIEWETKS